MPLFRRGKPQQTRPLVASARHIKLGDRTEAERARRIRGLTAWQQDAWTYRDAIGEIRYPMEFMANAITRMRIYPALQMAPDEPPVKLDEAKNVPADLVATAHADLEVLGRGNSGLRPILSSYYVNNKIAGEMYLVGFVDDESGEENWSIRSLDEVHLDDRGDVWLRDDPTASTSDPDGLRRLDPESTYVSRIWTPHKRWRALADSPMKPLLDRCEELLLVSRVVRASARSRLAGNGLLLIAEELSLKGVDVDDEDAQSDPFFEELTKSMLTPISEEGDASSVVPIVARVPGEFLKEGKAAQYVDFGRNFDGKAMELRAELIERIANGLDLPQEIVTGKKDLNHWTAWEVDDNTFRNHIEPDVIAQVDGLTAAYVHPMLASRGSWDPDLVRRICYWYDPVELVTHPDRGADAQQAFDRGAIGREALRTVTGFTDDDKPDEVDEALYVIGHSRGAPPEVVTALVQKVAPGLNVAAAAAELGDAQQPGGGSAPQAPASAGQPVAGPPGTPGGEAPTQRPTTAAATVELDVEEIQARGVMVAFYPTGEQARQLAIDGGEPAGDIHCTLAYLGHAEDLTGEQVQAIHDVCQTAAGGCAPLDGEFGGIGRFTADGSPDGDPVYASVDVPGLASLRTQIAEALAEAGLPVASDHGFTPHATLAYIPSDAPMPAHRLDPVPATFGALSVVVGPDRTDYDLTGDTKPLVAAAPARKMHEHASRQLVDVDRQLRARLLTACDAAVRRQLERAGARLRSRAQHDPAMRAQLATVPQALVAFTLGKDAVAAFGIAEKDLIGTDWSELQQQWDAWVARAQAQARKVAASIAGVPDDAPSLDDLAARQDTARDAGWTSLAAGLSALVLARLYDPHPDAPPLGEHDATLTVPPSLVRDALSVAGGTDGTASVDVPAGAFGIGNGGDIAAFLADAGAEADHRLWRHGDTDRAFEPHADLDGEEFVNFDDPVLENTSGWPEVAYYAAGDHDGCTCDWEVVWSTGGAEEPIAAAAPVRTVTLTPAPHMDPAAEMARALIAMAERPLPEVHLHLPTGRRRIERDDRGEITAITEE